MSSAIAIRHIEDSVSLLINTYGFLCDGTENSMIMKVPKELGRGFFQSFFINKDLTLGITKLNLTRPIIMNYENYNNQFETTYCLSGHIGYAETGIVETGLRKNEYGIYLKQQSRGMIMYPSNEDIYAVSILAKGELLENLPFFNDCINEKENCHRNLVNHLISPQKSELTIHNMFMNVIDNDYNNDLQPLMREGLTKTIIASLWQRCVVKPIEGQESCRFIERDQKAFHQAAHILEQNYEEPPTIPELCKMVGLNEYKLKIGFRAIYGKTIYEYAHDIRMKTARVLLENYELTISQVAYRVGYINASHFSRAFHKQFGFNPSDLRNGL